jgi:hypothetical protein
LDPRRAQIDRSLLDRTYARPEFQSAKEEDEQADCISDLIETWLKGFFESGDSPGFSSFSRRVVLGLFVAIAATGLLLALSRLRFRKARGAKPQSTPLTSGSPTAPHPTSHWERATRALATNPREAMRQGWLALLFRFEERRWLAPGRVETNREVGNHLAQRGAPTSLQEQVESLGQAFDVAFYSLAPVTPTDAEGFLSQVAKLLQLTERASEPSP